jgi:hypothetical protein
MLDAACPENHLRVGDQGIPHMARISIGHCAPMIRIGAEQAMLHSDNEKCRGVTEALAAAV